MEESIVKAKKHLNTVAKVFLFIFYSALYIVPLILGLWADSIVSGICIKLNLGYEHGIGETLAISTFVGVILLGLLILIITENILYKKTDIPKFFFVLSPLIVVAFAVADFIYLFNTEGSYFAYDNGILILYIMLLGSVKAVADGIRLLKGKNFKLLPLCLVSLVFCFSCQFFCEWYENIAYSLMGTCESDRTDSWSSINQLIERDSSWKEIVTDTEFAIGEAEARTDEEGWVNYYCSMGTYPAIDGSTVCVPMAAEFARQHLNLSDDNSRNLSNFSTTHVAYMNLITKDPMYPGYLMDENGYDFEYIDMDAKPVDLVLATHPSEDELNTAREYGVELVLEPVCYDAFVFITHKNNPIDSLTVQQVKDIYSGKITNWKEVGGKNEKIRAFQREPNSGSQTAMEELVMGGVGMIDPIKVKVIEGMGMLVNAVAEYENKTASIGYTYRYYIDNLYKNDNIKTIAIEGVSPTDENIRGGVYPYSTNYYAVIRKEDENSTGGKFMKWILSDEGQQCIKQAGYIPVSSK